MGMGSRQAEANGASAAFVCARCGFVSGRDAKFCSQCGARLAESAGAAVPGDRAPAAGPGSGAALERRQVTVAFCDLVGSTSLAAELDPEDYRAILTDFHHCVAGAMSEFGGHVARFLGDGELIFFGFPEAHEDDAERAIHAALATMERVRALRVLGDRRLQARIGIATGLVVIGNLHGEIADNALDVAGETPNLAARLQGIAGPNTIVVAADTRKQVGDLFEWGDLGSLRLRGLRDGVQAWEVIGPKAVASRYDAQHDAGLAPMLDNDDVRDKLVTLWREARDGAGRVALVSGEGGVGKSRMAAAILEETTARHVLRYFCSPHRQGSPLHPYAQQIEWAAGFTREDSNDARLDKLDAVLVGASVQDKGLLAEIVNVAAGNRFPVPQLTPRTKRRLTLQALLAVLERLARERPTLVVFEDAQWMDETSRELLALTVARVAQLPVLLLVLARPEFIPDWIALPHVSHVTLPPLAPAIGAALVHIVAKNASLSRRIISDIVARADGIPLYIEELTKAVVEEQAPRGVGEANTVKESALPLSLQASLLSRLDRLGHAREVAEIAAAIGRDFTSDLLALVVDRGDLQRSLDALVASRLIVREASQPLRYSFKHALIRDAAYGIMVRERRRAVHTRIAQALETHFPEVVAGHPEVLAWHCTEGELVQKAAEYWLKAGHSALRRSAMHEALSHLRRGIAVLPQSETAPWRVQRELDLTIALGKAQIATQGYAIESTGETFGKAQALCAQLGNPPQLLAVLHGLWTRALLRAEFPSALRQAEDLLERGRASGDRMWLLMGNRFSGVTHHPLGEFNEASRLLENGLELYDPAQQATYWAMTVDDPRVIMLTYLSWSQMCLGNIANARKCSERAVAEATQMAHAYTLAHALNGAAFVALTIVSPQAALQRLDQLRAVLFDNGIAYYEAVETVFRGWCLAAMGEHARAIALLDAGMDAYRATGSRLYLSGFLRMSAEAHGWAGQLAKATDLVREAVAVMEATDQRWDEAEIHRVRGVLLRAAGDGDAARRALDEASAAARRQGAKLWELRAACDLADLLVAREARDEAATILAPILEAFEADAEIPDLARARALALAVRESAH
jgi:class 3 adenylate cyclase/predicted ATPase